MSLLDNLIDSAPLVGKGAERQVYELSADYVIKVPKNRVRRQGEQSRLELEVYLNCPERLKYLLCPVVAHFYNQASIPVLIMPKMRVLDQTEMIKIRQARNRKVRQMREAGVPKADRDVKALEIYFEICGLEEYERFRQDIAELCSTFSLHDKEFLHNYRNWGVEDDGKVKFLDYGYKGRGDE